MDSSSADKDNRKLMNNHRYSPSDQVYQYSQKYHSVKEEASHKKEEASNSEKADYDNDYNNQQIDRYSVDYNSNYYYEDDYHEATDKDLSASTTQSLFKQSDVKDTTTNNNNDTEDKDYEYYYYYTYDYVDPKDLQSASKIENLPRPSYQSRSEEDKS
jgi:hypothetical protein